MRYGSKVQSIQCFRGDVNCRVKTDGMLGDADAVINRIATKLKLPPAGQGCGTPYCHHRHIIAAKPNR